MAKKKYYTGKSKIQGKGAFANENLKPGDYIGKVHTINMPFVDYSFTELGKSHNHSENPNVQNVLIGNERHLMATKPIKKGQELTSNYRLQPDLEQPESFEQAKKGKKLSPQKAKKILHDKSVHGKPLTDKQRKFFGAVASGYIKAQNGTVTPEMKKGWEAYRTYLDESGLFGDPRLNKSFGKQTFIDWSTKNPQYGVTWDTLPLIGQELAKQKQGVLKAIEQGRITMNIPASEYNPTEQTNLKTKNPWWPGTEFTAQFFPEHEETLLGPKGEIVSQKNYGVLPATETYQTPKITSEMKRTGGWLDKYQDGGSAESRMGGLTDIPFRYNSAWGGAFEDGGWLDKHQDGGLIQPPMAGANQTVPMAQIGKRLKKLEGQVNRYLEGPKGRGADQAYEDVEKGRAKEEDTLRHAYTSMETSKAIQDRTGNIPLISGSLGFLGANALGLGHEVAGLFHPDVNMMQVRETGEDIINNLVGSVAASIPFVSDEKKRKALQYLSDKGILPDGTTAGRGRRYDVIGKTYASGGSLPGSVGFTYARTKGIPSEGPYAKKTMPSAQNGMTFYQHGLDWKPRNISQNGKKVSNNSMFRAYDPSKNAPKLGCPSGHKWYAGNALERGKCLPIAEWNKKVNALNEWNKKEQLKEQEKQKALANSRKIEILESPYASTGLDWMGGDPLAQFRSQELARSRMPQPESSLPKMAYLSQGTPRTKESDARRYQLNKQYASQTGSKFNYKTGDVARPNDKTAKGGSWGNVQTPALVQTFASMTPSGSVEIGDIGARTFTAMNPITGPAVSAGNVTQLALGRDPYGFNDEGVISNILPALGLAADVAGMGSVGLVKGSKALSPTRVIQSTYEQPLRGLIKSLDKFVLPTMLEAQQQMGATKFNKFLRENQLLARQIYGDEAYQNFLKYGPTTQPGVPRGSQLIKHFATRREPVSYAGGEEIFEIIPTMSPSKQYNYPYFSKESLWYGPRQARTMGSGERVIVADPKSFPEETFAPAGEATIITSEAPSQKLIGAYAGRRRAMLPFEGTEDPSKFKVYEKTPFGEYVPEGYLPWEDITPIQKKRGGGWLDKYE